MKRKLSKIISFFMVFGFIISVNNVNVYAATTTVDSAYSYRSQYGYDYYFYSSATRFDSSSVYGLTRCMSDGSGNIPTGYMGSFSRLYSSGGTLVASSDWYYNQSATAGVGTSTPFITSAGTYYSKGRVALYNGNGYTTYEANSTPNLIISGSSFMGIFNVATNVNGDIYGSELMADALGIELDLIAARGENNMLGYVRSTDLNATKINDPTEISKLEIRRTIPLYSVDGLTVIDNFIIDNSGVEIFVN